MPTPITRIMFCLTLCLVLVSYWGCPSQTCTKHQDVASVALEKYVGYGENSHIDSIAMITNDSITGCGNPRYSVVIGAEAHRMKFPINARIQLFAQGNLWKEFFFKMDRNTVLKVYNGFECSLSDNSPFSFHNAISLAKKQNRFIDSSYTNDYCWLFEKMSDSYDYYRCSEFSVDGKVELCDMW